MNKGKLKVTKMMFSVLQIKGRTNARSVCCRMNKMESFWMDRLVFHKKWLKMNIYFTVLILLKKMENMFVNYVVLSSIQIQMEYVSQ